MVFVIGGAYGVSSAVEERANYVWKLSSLVFPHMLVRVIVLEQLYRAMTIIKGEKYHHE
jgi:23S rRNA (pseudouridine1915-N3)-methyltransferase